MEDLTLAETFAGIGGWSEAAKMAGGIRPVWRSEIDNYKNKVYDLRHPGVPNLGNIRDIITPPPTPISIPYHSPVLISRLREKVQELKGRIAGYGLKRSALLGWVDQNTQSLKTAQGSISVDLTKSWSDLPRSGMMQNGRIYLARSLVCSISGKGYFLLPTPTKSDSCGAVKSRFFGEYRPGGMGMMLRSYFRDGPTDPVYLNPVLTEVLMTFPASYTDLNVQEMPLYH